LRRRAHRRQTTVFTTPKRVLTSVFSVFALLNQPRFTLFNSKKIQDFTATLGSITPVTHWCTFGRASHSERIQRLTIWNDR
jgi:hypothetical protein